jgi:hypothetical protein
MNEKCATETLDEWVTLYFKKMIGQVSKGQQGRAMRA